jgi:DNA-binding MarR family transcriptional regulator
MRPRSRTLHVLERLCRLAREADEASPLCALDITHRELTLLDAIQNGSGTFRQLAALDGVSRAAIRSVVERLEARRLARRVRVVGAAAHEIELTTAGREALAARASLDAACGTALEKRLGADAKNLIASLDRILVERGLLAAPNAAIEPESEPEVTKPHKKSTNGKGVSRHA